MNLPRESGPGEHDNSQKYTKEKFVEMEIELLRALDAEEHLKTNRTILLEKQPCDRKYIVKACRESSKLLKEMKQAVMKRMTQLYSLSMEEADVLNKEYDRLLNQIENATITPSEAERALHDFKIDRLGMHKVEEEKK